MYLQVTTCEEKSFHITGVHQRFLCEPVSVLLVAGRSRDSHADDALERPMRSLFQNQCNRTLFSIHLSIY